MNKVKVTLELDKEIVKEIERLTNLPIKECLENDINQEGFTFIEMMGYDNE